MSLYNMLFGMNSKADLLLAVVGLKKIDVERFRDVWVEDGGGAIVIHSRTGGGNREDYPQALMRGLPGWETSEDEEFDSTYCDDYFSVPEQWRSDVANLDDILAHGIRPEFAQHIAKTIRREPGEADIAANLRDEERRALARTAHTMLNGHTFVPHDDRALMVALGFAEANGGELRTCWGIAPMRIVVKRDFNPYPNAKTERDRAVLNRIDVSCVWETDAPYWEHIQARYEAGYPLTFAKIRLEAERYAKAQGNG